MGWTVRLAIVTPLAVAALGAALTLSVGGQETPLPTAPEASATPAERALRVLDETETDVRAIRRELEEQRTLLDQLERAQARRDPAAMVREPWPQPDILRPPYEGPHHRAEPEAP